MFVEPIARDIVKDRGLKQNWVAERMNTLNPALNMTPVKFSAIICGSRTMTGDELLAFCRVTDTSPDYFLQKQNTAT